uniref:Uncharacterized protein n=1 Tax=Daphnia galeata TaxID=27404 RepID=A0A8J2RLQ7_9CRUS|nr:unnamed protein product [Daphnia galeata]
MEGKSAAKIEHARSPGNIEGIQLRNEMGVDFYPLLSTVFLASLSSRTFLLKIILSNFNWLELNMNMRLLQNPFISVVGPQAVKEALHNNDLNGRPTGAILLSRTFGESLDEHLSTRLQAEVARDFIDVYMDEMEEQLKANVSTTFSKKQLICSIQDLFAAGSHTSASSIGFAVLYLIHYPEVQQKMREELDNVCGDSLPSLAHRSRLPYTEAVLMEVMRMASIAPLAIPHRAMKETQLQGFTIPKGSIIAINLDSAFKDATVWEDAENFRPERHLDQNGKVIKNDAFTPFGIGKRICLGEPLARNTVFLFVASLVKTFELKSVPNKPLPTLEPEAGIILGSKTVQSCNNQLIASVQDLITGGSETTANSIALHNNDLNGRPTGAILLSRTFGESLDEHLSTRLQAEVARDFIDVYMDEMEEQLKANVSTTFSKKQLICSIQDLFAAGSHTSASSIGFAVLYLIHYPEVQQKMREELDNVCGDSLPSLAHRSRLPYTEAVLMEVMRMASIAPLAIPHRAMKETQLQGFTIPKGSIIAINLDSAFKDATVWEDAENFRPERHLDQNGKVIKNDAFTPFGIGKRICLGEPLARNTVFLFVASLVKTFELKSVPNKPLPTLEPEAGIILGPKPFKAVVIPRV